MRRFRLKKSFFVGLWTLSIVSFITPDYAVANDPVDPLLHQADAHFKDEYFYQASFFYQKVLDMAPHHPYAHFQIAECYRKLFHYESAKPHYEEVYQSEKEKYPLTGYYLALMYKLTGDYVQSIQYFDDFLVYVQSLRFDKKSSFIQLAQQEKEGCHYALKNTMKPKGRFCFSPLPFPVNTHYNDYAPVIYYHDSCLLITSTRTPIKNSKIDHQYGEYYSDHYQFCKAETSGWEDESRANNLSNLNTKFSEGSGYFLEKEKTLYFTGCYQEGYCHIYQSVLKNGEWESPVPMDKKINIPGYESKQPALTPGGDTLFFVSNRPGGFGEQDLWMSVRSRAATWEEPINLGVAINTVQNDVSPFYYPEENLLFFASNGHQGFGGFDLFMADYTNDSRTLSVINLGPPFNSYKDDLYLSLGKQKGYLSSNRDKSSGDFDIYTFEITSPDAVLLSMQNTGTKSLSLNEYFDVLRFFSAQDQQNFEELPLEEKIKIKRYIEMQAFREIVAEKTSFHDDLLLYYEQLPLKEKEFVDRMVTARKNMVLRENENVLLAEDEYFYQQLALEKKETIERIVEARFYQKILQEDTNTFDSLQVYFESLPLEEREQIQRTLAESKKFIAKNYQDELSLEDLFFYHALPTEEKEVIERTFNTVLFDQKSSQQTGLSEGTATHYYEQLPLEAQEQIHRIVKARQFTAVVIQDNSKLDAMAEADHLDIGMLAIGNPKNISIEGKMSYKGKPANAVKVGLTSDDGQNEKLTVTNTDGNFKFFNVDYHQHQKIFFGEEDVKFMQLAQYTLDELKITVLQDTIIKQTFDNIYFETNQYTIPAEALSILDSLLNFHRKYTDVQIEISAYADTVGSESYNLQLSQKRAQTTYNYLIEKGVDPTALHIFGKGKEFPHDGQDLKYSRRVEFELQGVATSYNPTREVYVVQAQPDLKEIAMKYDLTLQALKKLNQNITDTPRPFTPVRILANE
jgi:outer membrane protein OmpA-like peptidoglycan-associated protein